MFERSAAFGVITIGILGGIGPWLFRLPTDTTSTSARCVSNVAWANRVEANASEKLLNALLKSLDELQRGRPATTAV
ncbi:MAG: hypothetical protein GY768_05985 [Planctomycetaceae bacterium]|nr:hypothetical protein [Planctomycetaceae bacterium]